MVSNWYTEKDLFFSDGFQSSLLYICKTSLEDAWFVQIMYHVITVSVGLKNYKKYFVRIIAYVAQCLLKYHDVPWIITKSA